MIVPDAHQIARTLAQYRTRRVDVELTPSLTFRMLEAPHAPRNSYWARIWPSSIAVSRWLLQEPELAASSKELGCGLGLVSMALAHRGVLAEGTDRVPHALAFAARNAAANALVGFSVSHLDWAEPTGEPSRLIVGADILYDQDAPARLFAMLEPGGLLSPGGKLVIGGPRRRAELFEELETKLRAAGYAHRQTSVGVDWEGQTDQIDIHVLERP